MNVNIISIMIKRKLVHLIFSLALCFSSVFMLSQPVHATDSEEWNVFNKEFTNYDGWSISKSTEAIKNQIIQEDDYITISTQSELTSANYSSSKYYWLVSPANLQFPTEDDIAVEFQVRVNKPTAYEKNEFSVRAAGVNDASGRIMKAMFYSATDEEAAHVVIYSTAGQHKVYVDTSVFNTYKFIIRERDASGNRNFDFYVNGEKELSDLNAPTMKGGDLIKAGHDNSSASQFDIKSIRVKANIDPQITSIDTATKYVSMHQKNTVEAIIYSMVIPTGSDYHVSVIDKNNQAIEGFTAMTIQSTSDETRQLLSLPNTLASGKYKVRVVFDGVTTDSEYFFVINEENAPTFPQFEFVDEPVLKEDHTYTSDLNPVANPVEWNFPSIIDTHKTPLVSANALVDEEGQPYRYYLFYAPHNDPGGIMLMTSQDLNGPWVDYENNPFIENSWADGQGGYYYQNVPHVSSPDVMFNEDEGLFFMYFHGNNLVTRYATSPDLVNWTYGDSAVHAKDFTSIGNEASYARVYEHPIDGLGNKYVMLLMVNDTAGVRKIYWAHSVDGKSWTAVKTPLADPLNAPEWIDYSSAGFNGPGEKGSFSGANMSGPFLMEWQDHWYLIAHGSNGDIMAIEVGENFDQEIHWGPIYDSVYDADAGRAGAPVFIQDDEFNWHMYYEGGIRLKNNIMHAVEAGEFAVNYQVLGSGSLSLSSRTAYTGARVDVTFEADTDYQLASVLVNGVEKINDVIDHRLVISDINDNLNIKAVYTTEEEIPALEISDLPDSISVGDRFSLITNDTEQGTWIYDQAYLTLVPSKTRTTSATFEAIQAGQTTLSYVRADGESVVLNVTINEEEPKEELIIEGLPTKVVVGTSFTLTANDKENQGQWIIDSSYFTSTTSGNKVTLTPLKAGQTTLKYVRADGESVVLNVTIGEGEPKQELVIEGLPTKVVVGTPFTLTATDETNQGQWIIDTEYFTTSINGNSVTLTPLKVGTVTISYTNKDGEVVSQTITIEAKTENGGTGTNPESPTLPNTGINDPLKISLVGISLGAGLILISKKRKQH